MCKSMTRKMETVPKSVLLRLMSVLLVTLAFGAGCMPSPSSGWGFTLPEGDVKRGEATFTSLHCNACHSLPGVEQLASAVEGAEPEVAVELGGKVARIKTYGELVTAVINPSHRLSLRYPTDTIANEDGESKMPSYNETMTVQQLTDIVSFLQSKYELLPYDQTYYPIY